MNWLLLVALTSSCLASDFSIPRFNRDNPPQSTHEQDQYAVKRQLGPGFWNARSKSGTWMMVELDAGAFAMGAWDAALTVDGEKHGCGERNIGFPNQFPSTSRVWGEEMAWTGVAVGAGWLLRLTHLPVAPYAPPAVAIIKRSLSVHRWYRTGCI
jgi:hypothetical protein